jgi:hypothetical protein
MECKMPKLMISITDAITGETVERELTKEELAQRAAEIAAAKAEETAKAEEAAIKAEARAAILNRLGLTEEEAALLLG